jgi:hypothetical protein
VTARIVDLYGVSDLARVLVGAMAGRASVVVDVAVRDRPDGDPIETFTAIGKSSGAGRARVAPTRRCSAPASASPTRSSSGGP